MLPSAQPQQPHIVDGPPQTLTHVTARKHSGGHGPCPHTPADEDDDVVVGVADGVTTLDGTVEIAVVEGALVALTGGGTGTLAAVTEGTTPFVELAG